MAAPGSVKTSIFLGKTAENPPVQAAEPSMTPVSILRAIVGGSKRRSCQSGESGHKTRVRAGLAGFYIAACRQRVLRRAIKSGDAPPHSGAQCRPWPLTTSSSTSKTCSPTLSMLANTTFRVKVFVGAKQQEGRVPFKLLARHAAAGRSCRVRSRSMRSGSNAVDMHIAYYIGRLIEKEPAAVIHIISRRHGLRSAGRIPQGQRRHLQARQVDHRNREARACQAAARPSRGKQRR